VGSGQRQAGRGRTLRHPGLSVSQAASSRFTPLSCRSRGMDEETPPRLSTRLTSTACRRSREPFTEEGPPERSAKDKENSSRGMLRMRCQLGAGSACSGAISQPSPSALLVLAFDPRVEVGEKLRPGSCSTTAFGAPDDSVIRHRSAEFHVSRATFRAAQNGGKRSELHVIRSSLGGSRLLEPSRATRT